MAEQEALSMRLAGKTVGVFVAEGFEDLEFWVPVMRLREEGATALIVGTIVVSLAFAQ